MSIDVVITRKTISIPSNSLTYSKIRIIFSIKTKANSPEIKKAKWSLSLSNFFVRFNGAYYDLNATDGNYHRIPIAFFLFT